LLAQPAYNEGPSDDDNRRQHDNEKHNSGSTHLSSSQISKSANEQKAPQRDTRLLGGSGV